MATLHPLTVHLPIGLLIGNLILTILYLRRGDPTLETAAYHCLWLGWLLLLPAIASGVFDAVRHISGGSTQSNALMWINAHALAGLAIAVVYWQAWQDRRRNPQILEPPTRRGYLIRLGIGAGLVVLTGWLGGQMVYVLQVGIGD
jgi:uncharacterized membrane protein